MSKNVGGIDRILRAIIGLALLGCAFFVLTIGSVLSYAIAAVGAILLLTSIISFCPLYRIIGTRTCKDR